MQQETGTCSPKPWHSSRIGGPLERKPRHPHEYRVALRNLKLAEDELGEWVGTGKKRTYSHITWVDKVEGLWKELNDPAGHLLDNIRHNMPQALLDCLALKAEDEYKGEMFFEVIHLVLIDHVVHKAKVDAQLCNIVELMANIGGPSPSQPSPTTTLFYPSVNSSRAGCDPETQTTRETQGQKMPDTGHNRLARFQS